MVIARKWFVKRVIYDPKCTLKIGQFENVRLESVETKGLWM